MTGWNPAWPNAASEMPPISGEISTARDLPEGDKKARNSERVPIEMGAGLRQRGGSGVSVQIMDLSTHGFRIETHLDLHEGADVWLRLPGLESCHATVAWVRGYVAGCKFERPLHPAVLEMIVAKAQGH
jgi:PilZ domain